MQTSPLRNGVEDWPVPGGTDIGTATYDQIKIVPPTVIENVLATGRPTIESKKTIPGYARSNPFL